MKIKGIFIFVLGTAVGAAASYFLTKRVCYERKQEEIESVKEAFSKRAAAREKPDLSEFKEVIKSEGYSSVIESAEKRIDEGAPYVISPNEFAIDEDYDKISLTYFADGVLADDENNVVDFSIVGGEGYHNEFLELKEDAVYIRNEDKQADYEILADERTFSEVMSKSPMKIGGHGDKG